MSNICRNWLVAFVIALLLWSLGACRPKATEPEAAIDKPSAQPRIPPMPTTFSPQRLAKIGPEACVECHAEIVEEWRGTHHALANRPVDPAIDDPAFVPPHSVTDAGVTTTLSKNGGEFIISVDEADGTRSEHVLNGVIAVDPLRQYLAPMPNGAWQTTSVAFDVHHKEWFEVFSGEDRLPGEWGHWTGQGMNWNANCAACHMTEFKKNYDWKTGNYSSTWLQQGIACAECHGGLEAHVKNASRPGYKAPPGLKLSKPQVMDNCAACHSRRGQLTADGFSPGDEFHQHYELALPDQPGLYFADGQIRDEVFVYGSFRMSRMGHAGVSCLDCHNPHSNELILPAQNNMLCMRCHESGLDNAPVIKPTEHSHHSAGSTGNQCIECHMPHTTYMQRDPRRDHGFLAPDPLMTQEFGIPNACNRCHTDESVEWAVEWSEKWYGDKLADSRQRKRTRAIAAAHAGELAASDLISLANSEEIPAWEATYTGLLGRYAYEPAVTSFLINQLSHEDPLVRTRAVRALSPVHQALGDLYLRLDDDNRSVRLAAVDAFVGRTQLAPDKLSEWRDFQQFNSDRPQNAFVLADEAVRQGDVDRAKMFVQRAVDLDKLNSAVYQQAAVFFSRFQEPDRAEELLLKAIELNPNDPQSYYYLALLRAEAENYEEAAALLSDVVALQPEFHRAWYNLALAYMRLEQWQEAGDALDGAEPAMGQSPDFQRTRQMINQALGK
ncbi:MAG: tetratricopeptide repeat protein [Verrucomicrobiota bacterium]